MRTAVAFTLLGLACAAAQKPDASTTAEEVARVVLPPSSWERISATAQAQVDQMAARALETADPKVRRELDEIAPRLREEQHKLMQAVLPTYQEMLDVEVHLLAKHYTPDELSQLLAFYRGPLGQKTIRIMPDVTKDVMTWMQARMQERGQAAVRQYQAAVKGLLQEQIRDRERRPKST